MFVLLFCLKFRFVGYELNEAYVNIGSLVMNVEKSFFE